MGVVSEKWVGGTGDLSEANHGPQPGTESCVWLSSSLEACHIPGIAVTSLHTLLSAAAGEWALGVFISTLEFALILLDFRRNQCSCHFQGVDYPPGDSDIPSLGHW